MKENGKVNYLFDSFVSQIIVCCWAVISDRHPYLNRKSEKTLIVNYFTTNDLSQDNFFIAEF